MRRNKGITLVALVITIIILIILAGITMSLVLGEGGLINRTQQGAAMYEDQSIREKIQLAAITASANTEARFDKDVFRAQLNEYFGEGNYTLTINDETGEITVTVKGKVYTLNANGSMQDGEGTITYDPADDPTLGTDTSSATWDPDKQETGLAKLDLGETVNVRLKKLSAIAQGVSEEELDNMTVYNSEDNYITSIEWYSGNESGVKHDKYGQLAMTEDSVLGEDVDGTTNQLIVSDVPIWAWVEGTRIYIWSSDDTIDMHPHSERMFQGFKKLGNAPVLSKFVSDNVTTIRCMFYGCNMVFYSSYSPLDNWDISNIKTSLKVGQENLPGNNGFYMACQGVKYKSDVSGSNPPNFSERPGIWDSEGTYFPDSTKCTAYYLGDEVTIGSQNFYVIEDAASTENNIRVLTKYPLNKEGTAQVSDTSEDFKVAFSSAYYWEDEWNEFYDQTRYTEEEWNSSQYRPVGNLLDLNSIEGYSDGDAIDKAKKYPTTVGGTNGRLLTQEEYYYYNTSNLNSRNGGYKLSSIKFWTSSARQNQANSTAYAYNDLVSNNYGVGHYNTDNIAGVRPVLTLPRTSITLVERWK